MPPASAVKPPRLGTCSGHQDGAGALENPGAGRDCRSHGSPSLLELGKARFISWVCFLNGKKKKKKRKKEELAGKEGFPKFLLFITG